MGSLPTFNLHPPTSSSRTHFYVCIATRAYIYIYIPTLVSKSWFFFQRACTRVRACVCVYQQPARPCRATGVCGCVGCASLFLCRLPLFSQPTEINLYSFSSRHIYFFSLFLSALYSVLSIPLHSVIFAYIRKFLIVKPKRLEAGHQRLSLLDGLAYTQNVRHMYRRRGRQCVYKHCRSFCPVLFACNAGITDYIINVIYVMS